MTKINELSNRLTTLDRKDGDTEGLLRLAPANAVPFRHCRLEVQRIEDRRAAITDATSDQSGEQQRALVAALRPSLIASLCLPAENARLNRLQHPFGSPR
jgi:hypothetical protein